MTSDELDEREARVRERFDEALALRDAGELQHARRILEQLFVEHPERPPIVGVLAGLRYELGDYSSAAEAARVSVRLSPKSELASLTLFHAAMKLNELDAGFAEVARFRSNKHCLEYDRVLSEMESEALRETSAGASEASARDLLTRVQKELKVRPIKQ
jgi:predicted Zn-dependent protease